MAGFMDGDPAQAAIATGQGLGEQMAAPAAEAGRIDGEGAEGSGHRHGDPPRRESERGAGDGQQGEHQHRHPRREGSGRHDGLRLNGPDG
jgi:hypothetical protein